MRLIPHTFTAVLFLVLCQITVPAFGQLGISFDIKKPKEYDDRVLRSERSDQKKFTLPRRAIQNAVTRYNYVFNANNKLNEVLDKAKTAFKDDYSRLLPFYNYTLEATAADSIQLDSITYKASTGIALHDLRNDWVDNLYLLWGASYYLQQQFDSAYLMFQFINYAFAPKEKDGYYKAIGSNRDGNSALSIATKEKTSLPRRLFTEPPSRNDAFIWQIRNFLAQDQFAEAASLIVTLRNDPAFPSRLQNDLHEVQAYWFYKQNMWDSAVVHLVHAFDNATNNQEKARWEYLAAQLYEKTGQYKESEKLYAKVIGHTTDPVMAVYARLFSIRVNKDGGDNYIEKNINELVKMARRDRYQGYEDIIYYMAAQMELERNNIDGAIALLNRSTRFSVDNKIQHNRSFLQLAALTFDHHQYREAHDYYDSLYMDEPSLENKEEITQRKDLLNRLVVQLNIEARQDSLQRIAALTEEERKDFVKKLVKQMRKEQGLKDEAAIPTAGTSGTQLPPIAANTPLFPSGNTKGEWYFYNTASRTRGQTDFKTKWGNRPNQDNWRRFASVMAGFQNMSQMTQYSQGSLQGTNKQDAADNEITFDKLYKNLPLTIDQLNQSNDSLMNAMYTLGIAYIQEIEDCNIGTATLEELRNRFPRFKKMDELLFNLYYCYNKSSDHEKAESIKKLMTESYASSNFTTIINTGKNPKIVTANPEATAVYEHIYDLFVEGSFDDAIKEKRKADSVYKGNYWTPQLLYIEAVYYIRQRQDSTAGDILNNIISRYSNTPIGNRATKMLDVLSRRKQIEDELQQLQITRYNDSTGATKPVQTLPVAGNQPQTIKKDTVSKQTVSPPVTSTKQPKPAIKDSVATKTTPPPVSAAGYVFDDKAQQYVVVMMNKVDPVFMSEAKNAFFRYNRETYYNRQMTVDLVDFDADNRMLIISPFANATEAMAYLDKTKPVTATDIIPWLKGGKYSFLIASEKNLDALKSNKDIDAYRQFLNQYLPGKF